MDLEKWFFPDQVPGQMLYLGEEHSLLLIRAADGKWRESARYPHTLSDLASFSALPGASKGPLGLSLSPNPFVFNLFNFESPLPLNPRKRRELIQWRLQRVFPDAADDMIQTCQVFKRRTVLSALVSREIVRSCENHFGDLGYPVTYISCSSIDAVKKSARFSRQALLILEQEGQLLVVTLVKDGVPLFVRKIRFSQLDELVLALRKTIAFVQEQQGVNAGRYLVNPLGDCDCQAWLDQLSELQAVPFPHPADRLALFLP